MATGKSPKPPPNKRRSDAGRTAEAGGRAAERLVAAHLVQSGWNIAGARTRTPMGEIDLIATRDGLLLLAEVKSRADHEQASYALLPRQQKRLINAATWLLAEHPDWGAAGVRFDVFLVDRLGRIAQVEDAIRDDAT
jgi:putative endonuclease